MSSLLAGRTIAGKRALITGAGSGMGRATARLFAADGASVAVTDRAFDACQAVADDITEAGGSAYAWAMDVADPEAIRRVVAEVGDRMGGLDILVNNAGLATFASLDDAEAYEAAWARSLDVMLTAHQRVVRAALPFLRRSASPRIVNIASTEGLGATPGNSPYIAAKSGAVGLTRALAADLGKEAITVNCICPGPIHTAITEAIPEADKDTFARRRTALRRYGDPEEVAQVTLSVVLPASSYLTGAIIPVDGGLLVRNA